MSRLEIPLYARHYLRMPCAIAGLRWLAGCDDAKQPSAYALDQLRHAGCVEFQPFANDDKSERGMRLVLTDLGRQVHADNEALRGIERS